MASVKDGNCIFSSTMIGRIDPAMSEVIVLSEWVRRRDGAPHYMRCFEPRQTLAVEADEERLGFTRILEVKLQHCTLPITGMPGISRARWRE
jgi:hypothetical protein